MSDPQEVDQAKLDELLKRMLKTPHKAKPGKAPLRDKSVDDKRGC